MARTPTGHEVLGQAKALAKGAASVIELKQALTVLLRLRLVCPLQKQQKFWAYQALGRAKCVAVLSSAAALRRPWGRVGGGADSC